MAAGHQRMTDDAVADLDAFDAGSDGFHPSGILMAHDVGKLDVDLAAPDALDNMQVGAADTRAPDAYDYVHRAGDLGVGHILVADEFLRRQLFIECMENRGLHPSPPKNFFAWARRAHSSLSQGQQELCQGANKLMSLTFSSAKAFAFDPPRIKPDCATVPRRNIFWRRGRHVETRGQFWIFLQLSYGDER